MRPSNTVSKHPLPYMSYRSFQVFKISASEFDTVSMPGRTRACADEFLAMVTVKCFFFNYWELYYSKYNYKNYIWMHQLINKENG